MTVSLEDFQLGQEALYHELGDIYKVKIIQVRGNEKTEEYKLLVLKVLRINPEYDPESVGSVIPFSKPRNSESNIYGRLSN